MSPPVFMLSPELLAEVSSGTDVEVSGDEGKHGTRSLRLRIGETVELVDGAGRRAVGSVCDLASEAFSVTVQSVADEEKVHPTLTVVQALAKGDRGESAVEMLTESGVDRIVPWSAERSISVWKADRRERGLRRWRSTARAASKQARRSWLPEVADLHSTREVIELFGTQTQVFVLHENAPEPLARTPLSDTDEILLIVGPEGGVTDAEVDSFVSAGAQLVRLGDSVLRTSTAGVAAVSVVAARSGRWG